MVVVNRCTDATETIAETAGAKVVRDDSRCIAAVRNAGVNRSSGGVVVTIDADSVMHHDAFGEVKTLAEGQKVSFDVTQGPKGDQAANVVKV